MNTDVDTAARGRGDAVSGGRSTQPLRPRGPQERSGAGKPDSPAAGSRNTESPARPQHFFSRNERCRLRFQSASHDQLSSAQHRPVPPRCHGTRPRPRGASGSAVLDRPRAGSGAEPNAPGSVPAPRGTPEKRPRRGAPAAPLTGSDDDGQDVAVHVLLAGLRHNRTAPLRSPPGRAQHSAGSGTAPPGPLAAGPEVAVATRRAGGAPGRSGREGRDRRAACGSSARAPGRRAGN